jgi:hypothetical protein
LYALQADATLRPVQRLRNAQQLLPGFSDNSPDHPAVCHCYPIELCMTFVFPVLWAASPTPLLRTSMSSCRRSSPPINARPFPHYSDVLTITHRKCLHLSVWTSPEASSSVQRLDGTPKASLGRSVVQQYSTSLTLRHILQSSPHVEPMLRTCQNAVGSMPSGCRPLG